MDLTVVILSFIYAHVFLNLQIYKLIYIYSQRYLVSTTHILLISRFWLEYTEKSVGLLVSPMTL